MEQQLCHFLFPLTNLAIFFLPNGKNSLFFLKEKSLYIIIYRNLSFFDSGKLLFATSKLQTDFLSGETDKSYIYQELTGIIFHAGHHSK